MNTKLFSASILLVTTTLLFASGVVAQETTVSPSAVLSPDATNTQTHSEAPAANQTQEKKTTEQKTTELSSPNAQPAPITPFYQNANNAAPKVGSGSHLLTVTLGLMAIVGLIFALSWFVKRFTQGGFSGNAHIKILSAMPLGTRERLVLVETGGQQLLIGVTANNINTLHVLTTPIVIPEKTDITSDFSKKLMAIMQQKNVAETLGSTTTNNNNAAG